MRAQTDEDDRPVHPPRILEVEVLWNPFEDIVPRSTREEREAEAAAAKCGQFILSLLVCRAFPLYPVVPRHLSDALHVPFLGVTHPGHACLHAHPCILILAQCDILTCACTVRAVLPRSFVSPLLCAHVIGMLTEGSQVGRACQGHPVKGHSVRH